MKARLKRHANYHVYIVRAVDGTYYTGSTNALEHRLKLHNNGHGAKYLRGRGPVELVYVREYRYYKNALRAERYLKRQTRAYKEELIKVFESGRNVSSNQEQLPQWKPEASEIGPPRLR